MKNDFTKELLNYSAERDDCIGRPERWGNPPPLVIKTPLHDEMVAFAEEVWNGSDRLIWYFLVGGPGNGKSEATGTFVSELRTKSSLSGRGSIFDPANGLHGGSIKYHYHEKLPKDEMWVVQDVSVPKNLGSDPAVDLLRTLDHCANSGGHLLVCANRGMLLRATRHARTGGQYSWLFPILKRIDLQSQESAVATDSKWSECGREKGKQIEIRVWPLDHESILFGRGNGNPWAEPAGSLLDQILTAAVAPSKWESSGCADCIAREICPMYGDAIWLRDDERRKSVLKILRSAEILSGQRIVLREALGLVSMILVGCPSDFVSGKLELHPCDWVKAQLSGDPAKPKNPEALLNLISHRIYQDLFGRSTPTGIAIGHGHNARDKWICENLKGLGSLGVEVEQAIKRVDKIFPSHAGPLRLTGKEGILNILDPAKDSVWCARHNISINENIHDLRRLGVGFGLEHHLGELFQGLEDSVKALEPHKEHHKAFASIYRWASTLYLRLEGTARGEFELAENLAVYLELLRRPTLPLGTPSTTTLKELMKDAAKMGQQAELAPEFFAELAPFHLQPERARDRNEAPRWPANDRLLIKVTSPGIRKSPEVVITAATFLETWRKQILLIADWNISPAMGNLMRSWREDFIVTNKQFKNLTNIEYGGPQMLEFEFIGPTDIQVRIK